MCHLGASYGRGRGVPEDERETARLYRLAADQGHALAQCNLGTLYEHGRGVPQDEREAVRLYRLAADQGVAHFCLGSFLFEGTAEPATPERLREGALLLARTAHANIRQQALTLLSEHANEQAVAHTCCVGCGKSKLCSKCRVAKSCSAECAKRMWPVHKACCKLWAAAPNAAGGAAASS